MQIQKYAAIDIGSNAVRLLISTVTIPEKNNLPTRFKKTSLIRIPIRLGADVFLDGKISDRNARRMEDTIKAFSLIIKSYEITKFRACATSAMRSASNGLALAKSIKKNSGIDIQIIGGAEEAKYISATDLQEYIDLDKNYLYVDVGGGSTEFSVYSHGKVVESRSFEIGTVRLLHDLVTEGTWQEAEKWVRKTTKDYKDVSLIGTGGNINKIFKASGQKSGKPLSKEYLKKYAAMVKDLSYEDRIIDLRMKEDRADVIVPASEIYLRAMQWAHSRRIYVPKIGLADGIIKILFMEENGLI